MFLGGVSFSAFVNGQIRNSVSCTFNKTLCGWKGVGFDIVPRVGEVYGPGRSSDGFLITFLMDKTIIDGATERSTFRRLASHLLIPSMPTQISFKYMFYSPLPNSVTVWPDRINLQLFKIYPNGDRTCLWGLGSLRGMFNKWFPARVFLCDKRKFQLVFEATLQSLTSKQVQ